MPRPTVTAPHLDSTEVAPECVVLAASSSTCNERGAQRSGAPGLRGLARRLRGHLALNFSPRPSGLGCDRLAQPAARNALAQLPRPREISGLAGSFHEVAAACVHCCASTARAARWPRSDLDRRATRVCVAAARSSCDEVAGECRLVFDCARLAHWPGPPLRDVTPAAPASAYAAASLSAARPLARWPLRSKHRRAPARLVSPRPS